MEPLPKMPKVRQKREKHGDKLFREPAVWLAAVGVCHVGIYVWYARGAQLSVAAAAAVLLSPALVYIALTIWAVAFGRCRFFYIPAMIACIILIRTTNFRGLTWANGLYAAAFIVYAAAFIVYAAAICRDFRCGAKKSDRRKCMRLLLPILVWAGVVLVWIGLWRIAAFLDLSSDHFSGTLWEVPVVFDRDGTGSGLESAAGDPAAGMTAAVEGNMSDSGIIETLTYETKAYATDRRSVKKTAYVYVPAGYTPDRAYPILYLMHGTGDTAADWLLEHPENKQMLDCLIRKGDIPPVIVVTPTFYVENDCTGSQAQLDCLTRCFAEELRSDLLPAAEGAYHTYAAGTDEAGLQAGRKYRAFAGLSRGAMTACYSALAKHADLFSVIGAFSGSRMRNDFFEALAKEDLETYPIDCFYMSSGGYDFLLPEQMADYRRLLGLGSAFRQGENTRFDVFPMRYHSWGNWHLAFYNFLHYAFAEKGFAYEGGTQTK